MLLGVLAASAVVLFDPRPPSGVSTLPTGADKLVHATLFGVLAASAAWRSGRFRLPRAVMIASLLAAYAGVSELVQAFALPQRSGDVRDLAADLVGVAVVLVGWARTRRR